jgi:predicted phosphodiesterase
LENIMVTRIAVLSDIHGNLPALEAVLADLQKRSVQAILNLGDLASGPLWPHETLQMLMRQDWIHVAGNGDREIAHQDPRQHSPSNRYAYRALNDAERDWLRALPAGLLYQDEIRLFHGTPSSDTTYLLETVEDGRPRLATPAEIEQRLGPVRSPVMVCGHSHMARVVQLPTGGLAVNPGSVGLPAYSEDAPQPYVMESGSPHARYALLERRVTHWAVELIAVPYEHQKAADQARKNNRPDWEIGLRTGFMHK